jgi:DNA-directed RNA polymerase subunit K/omega
VAARPSVNILGVKQSLGSRHSRFYAVISAAYRSEQIEAIYEKLSAVPNNSAGISIYALVMVMARRGLSLSAKINSAVVLPILLAFIASGAAYIGIRQVSDEAQQVVSSGAALQAASELLVATERVGRLIGESGTQQEVAARLTPEVEHMRAVGAAVAEAVQGASMKPWRRSSSPTWGRSTRSCATA